MAPDLPDPAMAAAAWPKIDVLLVSVSRRPGGAERSAELLVESLSRQGVAVALASAGGAVAPAGCPYHDLHAFEPLRHATPWQWVIFACDWLACILQMLWLLIRLRPRVIHANTTAAMLAAMLPAKLLGMPIVWHVRDLVRLGRIGRLCGGAAGAIVCVSQAVREHMVVEGAPAAKMHVVYNGVRPAVSLLPDARRRSTRSQLGIPVDAFIYVNVGQFVPWKRHDVFLAAAAQVHRYEADAYFVLIGGCPPGGETCVADLEQYARQLGLHDCTVICPWQQDLPPLLASCDCLVHAAAAEPFGRVLIEAIDAGLAVVAVGAAGPAEIIENGVSGLLADPNSYHSLARQMLRVRREPGLAARLISAGRQRVATLFTADRAATAIRSIYDDLLREGAS